MLPEASKVISELLEVKVMLSEAFKAIPVELPENDPYVPVLFCKLMLPADASKVIFSCALILKLLSGLAVLIVYVRLDDPPFVPN
jgi:hypothetical protein